MPDVPHIPPRARQRWIIVMGRNRQYILSSEDEWVMKMGDLKRSGEIGRVLDTYITTFLPGDSRIPLTIPE